MTCTKLHRVGGTCQVDGLVATLLGIARLTELVDALCSECLQFINLHADGLFLVGSHIAEVVHQSCDLTFLAEIFQSELFYFLCVFRAQILNFLQEFVYFIKYHKTVKIAISRAKVLIFLDKSTKETKKNPFLCTYV